jgi:hypothetical protein
MNEQASPVVRDTSLRNTTRRPRLITVPSALGDTAWHHSSSKGRTTDAGCSVPHAIRRLR